MRDADRLALDVGAAHRGGVEEHVDEVVGQQVDLVGVEDPAVRRGQQPGLEGGDAVAQRAVEVERAEQAVGRRAHAAARRARPGGARRRRPSCGPSGQRAPSTAGSALKRQPATTSISGSNGASARTAVDFAVPRSPRTSTPPMRGSTAQASSASPSASCPTIAVKGKTARSWGHLRGASSPAI